MTPTVLDRLEKLASGASHDKWDHELDSVAPDEDFDLINACSPATILTLIKVIRMQREALDFYAQKPINDFRKNEWNDSCREWGLEPTTWGDPNNSPLIDLGDKAREALAECDKLLGALFASNSP